jgi:LacI family transcriptional regulator
MAAFAASEVMVMGTLVATREAGLGVPEEIAVVGFEDIPVARMITPG